jgi:hypothetical protein
MGRAPQRRASRSCKHNDGRPALFVLVSLLVAGFIAPPAPADEGGLVTPPPLVGRVLDERRFPVAGASVTLRRGRGDEALHATTDEDGRFEFVAPLAPDEPRGPFATLLVTTPDRRAGATHVFSLESRSAGRTVLLQYEPILLAPCGRLNVNVRDGLGTVATAAVELRFVHGSAAVAEARADEYGHAVIDPAPAGDFALFVKGEGRGRATVEAKVESGGTTEIDVKLRELRTLDVAVVDAADGAPVPGAEVVAVHLGSASDRDPFAGRYVREDLVAEPAVTDATGHLRLRDLEAGSRLSLDVRIDHYMKVPERGFPLSGKRRSSIVGADDGAATIELRRLEARTLHCRVDRAADPVPAEGTTFQVELPPRMSSGLADGVVVHGGVLRGDVLEVAAEFPPRERPGDEVDASLVGWAVAPDGSCAALQVDHDGDGFARFTDRTTLEVRLVAADGTPRSDASIRASSEGALRPGATPLNREAWTDATGTARFDSLPVGRWVLFTEGIRRVIDLDTTKAAVTLRPPAAAEMVLQFTVDGERRLPADLRVFIDGELSSRRREDPAHGDVHVFVVPDSRKPRPVRVFDPKSSQVEVPLPPLSALAPTLVPIALPSKNGAGAIARIHGVSAWQPRVVLERLDEARGVFVPDERRGALSPQSWNRESTLPLPGLEPGTWRLAIPATKTCGAAVRVEASGPAVQLELDVSTAVELAVVWAIPNGENRRFLEVGPTAFPSSRNYWRGWEREWPLAEDDGTAEATRRFAFDVRAPPRLDARHPYLVSSRVNDAIDLKNPRSAITLHMEVGPLLTMTPEFPDGAAKVDGAFVTLADPTASAATAGTPDVRRALRRGSTFAMAPPAAGARRVLIDPVVAAPVELASVAFDGGARDLGAIRFGRGSTLRVHARATPPFAAPSVMARALRIDGIAYERASSASAVAESPVDPEIRGLGKGRFRVVVENAAGDDAGLWTAEVRVDGEHDAEITIVTD